MRKIIFVVIISFFIYGCASMPRISKPTINYDFENYDFSGKDYINLNDFCKKYQLDYNFNTLDDLVVMDSSDFNIKLLLAANMFYCNGKVVETDKTPFYSKGVVFLPAEIDKILLDKIQKMGPMAISFVKTVVIDPGHGGKDPGAISKRGLQEKDVNLKAAKLLRTELRKLGLRVYMTRTNDRFISLDDRVKFAKRRNADLFISIHANANLSRHVRGFEVYYLSEEFYDRKSKTVSSLENAVFNSRRKGRRNLLDLVCIDKNRQSLLFAHKIINVFSKMGFNTKPPRGAPFRVLKCTSMPSVLVEMGYLSNSYEERLLRKPYYLKQIAQGIALSVRDIEKFYAKINSGD